MIERLKSSVMLYVTSDIVPVRETVVHLIIASADSRHTIATAGDNELRRVNRYLIPTWQSLFFSVTHACTHTHTHSLSTSPSLPSLA